MTMPIWTFPRNPDPMAVKMLRVCANVGVQQHAGWQSELGQTGIKEGGRLSLRGPMSVEMLRCLLDRASQDDAHLELF